MNSRAFVKTRKVLLKNKSLYKAIAPTSSRSFFYDFNIFAILLNGLHNRILFLEQSDDFNFRGLLMAF